MRKALPTLLILILIGVLGTAFYKNYWSLYTYSNEAADLNAHYGVRDEGDVPIIIQDILSDYHGRLIDGVVYLRIDDVHEIFTERLYYGEADAELLYCLPDARIRAAAGEYEWTDGEGNTVTESFRPCIVGDDTLLVALPFISHFANFSWEFFENPNRIRVYTEWGEQKTAVVKKDTKDRKSVV